MGALTLIRKRAYEFLTSFTSPPSATINSPNYSDYTNQNDTNSSKKPRISYLNQAEEKVKLQSSVERLRKYPEPVVKFRRQVHAPCRSKRFGVLSNSGSKSKKEDTTGMGNVESMRRVYDDTRRNALGVLRYFKVVEVPEEEEESSEVVIIEDGTEARLLGSDNKGRAVVESDELGLVVERDTKAVEKSLHLDREAYKKLLSSVERTYSSKLNSLGFQIKSYEAKLRGVRSTTKQKRKKEEEEVEVVVKKPEEDLLQELFAPLSEQEEGEVKTAFSNSNRRKVLVTHENSNIQITGEKLQCLRPGAWLNDEVINVYLELLKERERREPKKYLTCHFFNTFFYKKLIGGRNGYDYKAVKRWTSLRKLGYKLSECDKIFVPIHKEVHWCLAVINNKDKTFQYLDSLGGRDARVLTVLANYYKDEVKDKSGQDIDVNSWELEYVEDLPEQQNGFDCGVFMIKYADFYSRGLGLHFSQENMPYFRRRTAKEILRLQAL